MAFESRCIQVSLDWCSAPEVTPNIHFDHLFNFCFFPCKLWFDHLFSYRCNICNLSYKSRQTYGVHRFIHRSNVLRSFECDICKKTFARKNLIRSHIMSVHASKMKYQCDICRERWVKNNFTPIAFDFGEISFNLVLNFFCALVLSPNKIWRVTSVSPIMVRSFCFQQNYFGWI